LRKRLGDTYAFNSLKKSNAIIAFGSYWPITPAIPLDTIYVAVTRQTLDGTKQKVPEEQGFNATTKNISYHSRNLEK